MARIEEATLFKPGQIQLPGRAGPGAPVGGGGPGRGGGGGGGGGDDEGPSIAVRERVSEAARSASRRKGLSFVVVMICGALTVLAAIFAPRTYQVEANVLVQRTQAIGPTPDHYVSPEEMRATAREYEAQVMARDNIIAIVQQRDLVNRWDEMRQPHRRLIDKINRKLGKAAPSNDEKFEALVANIEGRMKVWVDANTISVKLDWSEPVAAKDIVEAAVKNFLDVRFQSEVGVIPARLKMQEGFVAQAHKELETAAGQLVMLQRANDPNKRLNVFVPALPQGVRNEPPPDADPALRAKLDAVRGQMGALQNNKHQRVAELHQQLIEKQQTLAPQHPEIVALKQTIAATEQDPPQLVNLRAQEAQLLTEINARQREATTAREKERPRFVAPAPAPVVDKPPEIPASAPKNVQDAQVQFDTASTKYQDLVKQLQSFQMLFQEAEANYKNRYRIVHPAEVPAAPKRPAGLIAALIGVLSTIAAVLAVAALADRLSGIFFEPREVRDRLGLPVFATFS